MHLVFRLIILLASLTVLANAAHAGRYNDWENWTSSGTAVLPDTATSRSSFRTVIGGGAGIAPEYLGGEEQELKLLPLAETTYAGKLFISTQQGLGYNLWRKRTVRAGPRLTFDFGRDSADSTALTGLPDIDFGVEVGGFLELYNGAWRLRADVKQEVANGHGGLLGSADVAWGSRWTKNTSIILGVGATVVDDTYAESYFGISDAVAARTSYAPYSPAAGVRDASAYVQFIFDFTHMFFLSVEGRAQVLLGDAAESPLVESETALTGSALVGVRF